MKKSECWLLFIIFSALLFQIYLSQDSTINQQDGDNFTYPQEGTGVIFQHCGETSTYQSVGEQNNSSPSSTSKDVIKLQRKNFPDRRILKTEVPKVVEAFGIETSMEGKKGNMNNSKENSTSNIKSSIKDFEWNVVVPQAPLLSKSKQKKAVILQSINNSLTGLAKIMTSSRYNPTLNVSVCEQNFYPSLTSNDFNQILGENCSESLILKTEVPKVVEASGIENSMEGKTENVGNSKENSISITKSSGKNFVRNVVAPQAPFLSKSKQEITQISQGIDNSLIGLTKKKIMFSSYNPTWTVSVSEVASISRSKREAAQNSPRKDQTLSWFQKSKASIFKVDQSLEALLRRIIVDHIYGCDLIIIYDKIYKETRTLETLLNMPFIKQVLQLVSVKDLSEKIQWESQNCLGTMLLMSDPEFLISFGGINRFLWAYRAKVIIVGLELYSLEKFLKTFKGSKTEHIIGVVEDAVNHNFEVYMNLLFWGEGMQLLTDWSDNRFTRRTNLFPDKIKDLRSAELNTMIFEYRPVSFYEYAPNGTIIERHGRFMAVVRTLAEKFNFTMNFIETEYAFGKRLENGSFLGIVGHFQRDEGLIGLPYFYHTGLENRHREADHSRYIEDDRVCFLVRREVPRPAWESLGLPFTPESWIAVMFGIIVSGPIFYLFVMASTATGEEYENFKSLSYSSLFTIGIQIDHPLVSMPKRLCNQIFIIFLLMYSLILTTGYRSNLISFLTVARPPKQIDTIKDLAESGFQVYGMDWIIPSLQDTGDPYLKKLLDRFEVRYSVEDYIDEFMEGKRAAVNSRFLLEGRSTLMRTKSGKPVTRFLKECVQTYMGTIIYQWHSPLNPRFDKVIANLVESGITRHWILEVIEFYKKFVEREGRVRYFPDVWRDDKDGLIPLSNNHLTGIWAALVIGYFLATASFAIEVIVTKEFL